MTRQRNKFWTFVFSLMPGCGQMYMGFMKRGLSLLFLFSLACFVAALLTMGELALLIVVIWFYAFFDALNLGWLEPERFALIEDNYLCADDTALRGVFKSRAGATKYVGIAMIVFGVAVLWQNTVARLIDLVYDYQPYLYEILWTINNMLPRIAVSVLLIVLGVRMIRAKKRQEEGALPQDEEKK
ncbi:MAG: hypothetical protein VB092_04075 [Oscillospiraceae bacterium]|nr:hypothetical protein [Oscillospiraceae bacterium]